jgi:hypothetical protein
MSKKQIALTVCGLGVLWTSCLAAIAQETTHIQSGFQAFSQAWNERAWEPQDSGQRPGYLRPFDDAGWKTRMELFRTLVIAGEQATDGLRGALVQGAIPERILAAQVLQLIPSRECASELASAAESDADPAVRLYAVDALGMSGGDEYEPTLLRLERGEKNHDVKRHIAYAIERKGITADASAAEALLRWDAKSLDSARVGDIAPDFELPSLAGGNVRLRDFRGKKSVVLVFVYGDT